MDRHPYDPAAEASLSRLMAYVADLELEVDRLRRQAFELFYRAAPARRAGSASGCRWSRCLSSRAAGR